MTSRAQGRVQPLGFVRPKFLVVVGFLAALGYAGSQLIPVYWSYFSMYDPVKEAAIAASRQGKDADARAALIERARGVGVELDEENVQIDRDGNFVVVRVVWEAPVDLRVYRRSLQFRLESRAPTP